MFSEPGSSNWETPPSLKIDACRLPSTVCSHDVLRYQIYQHLSAGYQLPTVCYNTVMKNSVIDPLLNFNVYELPMLPGHAERKDAPDTSVTSISVTVEDPSKTKVTPKMVLPYLITIRRKKMKKHKLKKLRKRLRFVMRRRRQKKEKRKEREIRQYEREQAKLGQAYNPEQYVDEQLTLARKSGWHIDIITEFSREQQKKRAASAAAAAAAGGASQESDSKQ